MVSQDEFGSFMWVCILDILYMSFVEVSAADVLDELSPLPKPIPSEEPGVIRSVVFWSVLTPSSVGLAQGSLRPFWGPDPNSS